MKMIDKAVLGCPDGSMFHIQLPKGAKILQVGPDPKMGEECVWYEFDPKNTTNLIPRTLEVFFDGNIVPPLSTHVLTFRSQNDMCHLYDHGEVLPAIGGKH